MRSCFDPLPCFGGADFFCGRLLHRILRYAQEDTLGLGARVFKRHFIRAKNPALW